MNIYACNISTLYKIHFYVLNYIFFASKDILHDKFAVKNYCKERNNLLKKVVKIVDLYMEISLYRNR